MTDIGILKAKFPPGVIEDDPDILLGYLYDRSNSLEAGKPMALARPRNDSDIAEILCFANQNKIPVTPRGAGTSLAGGSLAVDRSIIISTEKLKNISIDPDTLTAEVGAGVINEDLKIEAQKHGLWYPPDPSSYQMCSLGGNIATNAGGICCLKYGVTGDYVMGLNVILADSTQLVLGSKNIKDVAGYNLKSLFIGSEGTLGIITKAILRLVPKPKVSLTMLGHFGDISDAGKAISEIVKSLKPSALELIDFDTIRAVEEQYKLGLNKDAQALLIIQLDSSHANFAPEDEKVQPEKLFIETIFEKWGAFDCYETTDENEANMFMTARRQAIPCVTKLGRVLIEDIAVPINKISEMLAGIKKVAANKNVLIPTIGHAGDGNFHPLIVLEDNNESQNKRAWEAFGEIMDCAIALGGTITGEHGIGTLKRPWLQKQLQKETLSLMRKIKDLLDPNRILNPGKGF